MFNARVWGGVLLLAAGACFAQEPPAISPFEVASVKPNTSMSQNANLNRKPGGALDVSNFSLRMLITFAYDIRDHQLSGGSAWVDSDRWDIVARPDREGAIAEPAGYSEASMDRLRARVRLLLADRFNLTLRKDAKEANVLALVVAKNGPHLDPTKAEGPQINMRNGMLICKKQSMKSFADRVLSQRMGRTVVDKTGLSGEYDFEMKYVEESQAKPTAEKPLEAVIVNDAAGPTFVTALQEQLGLKLESQKGMIDNFTITRVEKASAN